MRNKILKTITGAAAIGMLISSCCLDADSWIPVIVLGVCMAWMLLFLAANQDRFDKL